MSCAGVGHRAPAGVSPRVDPRGGSVSTLTPHIEHRARGRAGLGIAADTGVGFDGESRPLEGNEPAGEIGSGSGDHQGGQRL